MGRKFDFDYIIIGSGPAGSTAARILAQNKKIRVAIIENYIYGGSNLGTRDIPYLVGQSFAHTFYNLQQSPAIGAQKLHFNYPAAISHQTAVAKLLGAGDKKSLEDIGVTCIEGSAKFLDDHTIAVNEQTFTSNFFIIATGSTLATGNISGLNTVDYLTPITAFKLRHLPKLIVIVGGGATGCEIAEYYAKLGIKVIIMEQSSRLLPNEDPEAGNTLRDYFAHELGIIVATDSKVLAIENDGVAKRIIFRSGQQEKMVRIEHVVLATGSVPATANLDLKNAGVRTRESGAIMANKLFQTTAKNIYAIGDCLGNVNSSTERAEYEGSILADNLLHKTKNIVSYKGFIRLVNTDPQIASVGRTEAKLEKKRIKYAKAVIDIKSLPASTVDGLDYGFIKLIVSRRTNHILGATIMAPGAALMTEELSLALRHHISIRELASTPHIANSYNYAIKLAAKQLVK